MLEVRANDAFKTRQTKGVVASGDLLTGIGLQFGEKLGSCDAHIVVDGMAKATYLEDQLPVNKGVDWSTYLLADREVTVKNAGGLSDVSSLALEFVHTDIQVT